MREKLFLKKEPFIYFSALPDSKAVPRWHASQEIKRYVVLYYHGHTRAGSVKLQEKQDAALQREPFGMLCDALIVVMYQTLPLFCL